MRRLFLAIAIATLIFSASFEAPAGANAFDFGHAFTPRIVAAAADRPCARVYGFTGLGGQIPGYSLGVFTELDEIAKAFPCVKTYRRAWSDSGPTYETVKANYRLFGEPIFLIGHSMGADAALRTARRLQADGIPVATVFSYDPTRSQSGCVPGNVLTFINWRGTRFGNLGRGNPQKCDGDATTAMQDYPLNVQHVLLDDLPTVHSLTTKHVGEVLHMLDEMRGAKRSTGSDLISAARRRGGTTTDPGCLTPAARSLWYRAKAAFPDARLVSTCRAGAVTPSGQPSYHASGKAFDWTTSRKAAAVAWSRANAPGLTMTYPDSAHIHTDVGRWKAYAHGYGGRTIGARRRR